MMSKPAFACEAAVLAASSKVGSLSTLPPLTMPQWPWSVYSQKHRSAIRRRLGCLSLMAFAAFCTMPLSEYAPVAFASFLSGMPKRIRPGMPSRTAASAAFTAMSTEYWKWPGIEEIGRFSPLPGRMKRGRMKSLAVSSVSRIRDRRTGLERKRRGRVIGKLIRRILHHLTGRFSAKKKPRPIRRRRIAPGLPSSR